MLEYLSQESPLKSTWPTVRTQIQREGQADPPLRACTALCARRWVPLWMERGEKARVFLDLFTFYSVFFPSRVL